MSGKNDEWLKAAYPKCLDTLKKYLCRFVGSPDVAEDLAHDAFMRVWAAPNFDETKGKEGYLFVTARNLARNRNSLHSVAKTDAAAEVADLADERSSVEREAMTAEEYAIICKAMSHLSERRQKVLVLFGFLGYSCQEIADNLRVSRRTIHRELAAAIESVHSAKELRESEMAQHYAQVIAIERDGESTA